MMGWIFMSKNDREAIKKEAQEYARVRDEKEQQSVYQAGSFMIQISALQREIHYLEMEKEVFFKKEQKLYEKVNDLHVENAALRVALKQVVEGLAPMPAGDVPVGVMMALRDHGDVIEKARGIKK